MLDKQPFVHEEIAEDFLCREQTRNLFGQPDVIVIHEYLTCLSQQYCSHAGDKTDRSGAGRRNRLLPSSTVQQKLDAEKGSSAKRPNGSLTRMKTGYSGFDNICEMLKLDPDYIRRVLKQNAQERLLNQPSGQPFRISRQSHCV